MGKFTNSESKDITKSKKKSSSQPLNSISLKSD